MSEARIRRGGTSRLSVKGQAKVTARSRRGAVRPKSAFDLWLARLPISKAGINRLVNWAILLLIAGLLWAGASFFGLFGALRMEVGVLAARAGFQVEKVEVHGTERMDNMSVYTIALGQVDRSMLNIDLAKVRQDIMRLSWVQDARVSRRLPDTLVIDVVERKPAAVWQQGGRLSLIDANGVVLEAVSPNAMPDLPLLVGNDANRQAARLDRLMEAAPALKPVLAGATWVGNRRWDLRFQSGETLSLPEGDEQAAGALINFARLDGINRLLGRGIPRFDMRDPDKFILRLPKGTDAASMPGIATEEGDGAEDEASDTPAENEKKEGAGVAALREGQG